MAKKTLSKKLVCVGNLTLQVNEQDLRTLFECHGKVHSVKIVMDQATGLSRGLGFVEMDTPQALDAILALDKKEFFGKPLSVDDTDIQSA